MIISTAVSEVVVISQLKLLLFYQKIHYTAILLFLILMTIYLKLKEYSNIIRLNLKYNL